VHVRVMLNPSRRDGTTDNQVAREALLAAGVEVHDSSTEFAVTHQKSMVVDNRIGFIESLNWETRDLTETRDYAVETNCETEISEMVRCFNADWFEQPFEPRAGSGLIWCPNNGRQRIADFIDGAHETLWLQNERYQDMVIIERLVRAAKRGVRVRIMSRALHNLKKKKLFEGVSGLRIVHNVGAKVRALKDLKLHGKIMIADDERAIVGSINLLFQTCGEAAGRDRAARLEAFVQVASVGRGRTGGSRRPWRQRSKPAGVGSRRGPPWTTPWICRVIVGADRTHLLAIHSVPGMSACCTRRSIKRWRRSRTASPALVRGKSAEHAIEQMRYMGGSINTGFAKA
jgi:hypothetical protein